MRGTSVPPQENHYQVLGLDLSATSEEIEQSLQRLESEADKLAYSAPEQSQELWARIRKIRTDLLSSSDRRYAYDSSVVDGWGGEFGAPERQTRQPAVPTILPARPVEKSTRRLPGAEWLLALATGLILVAIAFAWWVNRQPSRQHPTYASGVSLALSSSGIQHGSKYVSGQVLYLQWKPVSGVRTYQGQIATSARNSPETAVFAHPLQTFQTGHSWYQLRIVGEQVYYWRVRALLHGHWTAYSAIHHFAVDMPRTTSPFTLIPENGALLTSRRVQICWSPIPGAVGYHVQLRGEEAIDVRGACVTRTLAPGRHYWAVAAKVRGANTYVGPYSGRAYFTIRLVRPREVAVRQNKKNNAHPRPNKPSVAGAASALEAAVIRVPAITESSVRSNTVATSSRVHGSASVRRTAQVHTQTSATRGATVRRQPVYRPRMHRIPPPPAPPVRQPVRTNPVVKKPVVAAPVPAAPATVTSSQPVVAGGGFQVQGTGSSNGQTVVVQAPVARTRGVNPGTPRYSTAATPVAHPAAPSTPVTRPVVTAPNPAPVVSTSPTPVASPATDDNQEGNQSSGRGACQGKCRGH